MRNTNKKGFTIVELVIVVAVIAILAAVLIPTFSGIIAKANESSDIKAIRDMNTFLAVGNATNEVDSILDVYDIFAESGFKVKNYTPLHDGRTFYFDAQYKKVLYVDNATGKVLSPAEHKDETQGNHDWFALSMEIETIAINPTVSDNTQTYSVSSAGQYAYIVERLNTAFPANTNIVINLQSDIDLKGANVAVSIVPAGASYTINGNGKTIKNITANTFSSTGEGADSERKYIAAGLVGESKGNITITNVVLENVNVKETNAGNVAVLIGSASAGSLKISDVTIKNSTIIGHRSVGALSGMVYVNTELSNVTLENVSVNTIAGRSGLLFGWVSTTPTISGVDTCTFTNSKLSIYECEQNAGGISAYTENKVYNNAFMNVTANATQNIHSYSIETNGQKAYRDYGFNPNALWCQWPGVTEFYYFELAN